MIVELFGAPGSGKTTLLPVVLDSARTDGHRAYTAVEAARVVARRTRLGRLAAWALPESLQRAAQWQVYFISSTWSAARFALRRPRLVWFLVRAQRRRPPGAERRRRRVIYWFFRFTGSYEFFRTHLGPGELVVFDEGFAHRAVQLFASSVEIPLLGHLAAYADLLPRPDLLVYVHAPADVCLDRVRARGVWARMAGKDVAEVSDFVSNAHRAITLMVDQARRRSWPLIEVDNSGLDPAESASRLRDGLERTPAFSGWSDA